MVGEPSRVRVVGADEVAVGSVVSVAAGCAGALVGSGAVVSVGWAGAGSVAVGAGAGSTTTSKLPAAVWPAVSIAVQVTAVVPTPKTEPDGMSHERSATPTSSLAPR